MEIEWDEKKNRINCEKDGIEFIDAVKLFANDHKVKKSNYVHEERWLATGEYQGKRLTIVFTKREGKYRIISARRAKKPE